MLAGHVRQGGSILSTISTNQQPDWLGGAAIPHICMQGRVSEDSSALAGGFNDQSFTMLTSPLRSAAHSVRP